MAWSRAGLVALTALLATATHVRGSSWSETRYGTADDLPSPYVKSGVEDTVGFVWLATDGGLVRFDGSTFTSYLDAPSGRFVKAVALLPDGRVLVAGDAGVSVVSATPRGPRIEPLVPAAEQPSSTALHYPKALFVDSHGRAWVSEMEAVALLLGGSRFERFAFPSEARSTAFVRSFSLTEDDRGRIWAASRAGELFAFDETARRFVAVPLPAGTPATANTNHLAAVADGVLWLASEGGLVEIRLAADRAGVRSAHALPGFVAPSWISRLGADVLVASYGGPMRRVAPGRPGPGPPLCSAGVVQHAFVARSGDIYLSTDDGLVLLRRRPFEALPLPAGELPFNVQSFALGPHGVLYACDRRSVYRLEQDGTSLRTVRELDLSGTMLLGLLGDGTRLAVAGLGRLVLVAEGRVTRTLDLSERGTHVVGLATTRDGSMWIAQFDSKGALHLRPDGTLKAYAADAGLPGRVIALHVDKDGGLYATGAGRASYLFRYDPARDSFANLSRPLHFTPPEPFDVRDVEVDQAGRVWLASTAGLLEQDAGAVRRVDLGPELTGLPTHSLAQTDDGRLWIATAVGLVGFEPRRHTYELYDEGSGLPSKNLGFHGLFKLGDELLVATTRGIARARVGELGAKPAAPPVIVQVRANGEELDLGDPGVLAVPHGVWLAARAASPGGGERTYQWKVEPGDADWRPPSARPEAVLPTRGSGEHLLLVRAAARGSNVWGPPTHLRLRVAPAWYERWWAAALLAAVLTSVFAVGLLIARAAAHRNELRLKQLVVERTRELQDANEQLSATNAELERFAYTVSHDLKSPLVTIRGFLEFLEPSARRGDFKGLRGDIARIRHATDRMTTLLHELLDLSRVGRVRNPPEVQPFAEIVREAARLSEGALRARGISLEVADGLPSVRGDRVRLVQLVQNLIENAAKFSGSQPQPRVVVGARLSASSRVFFVKDEGIGVDRAHHERIFALFTKLDAHSEGTGVGLAIAKRIVETHGGRLWVESEGKGRGSTFCFTLPG